MLPAAADPIPAVVRRGAAEPVTTTRESQATTTTVDSGGAISEATTLVERVTTTLNYRGVEGLLLIERARPVWVQEQVEVAGSANADGQPVQATTMVSQFEMRTVLVFPAWLLQAYGDNAAAIRADLDADILKNRGPCS